MSTFKKNGILIFVLALITHCAFIYSGWEMGRIVSKLLLVPILIIYLYASLPKGKLSPSPVVVFIALFFSFLGDLFLTQEGTMFFLLGMVGFIVTHVCNSIYFLKLQRFSFSKPLPASLALVIIVMAIFFVFRLMQENLGDFKVPILAYMAIIAGMGILATNVILSPVYRKAAATLLIPGAGLFIVSDAILAVDKFYFHQPEIWSIPVMATYGLAQLLLVKGVEKTISNT